jgi:hypothetical protein
MDIYSEQVRKANEYGTYRHYTTVDSLTKILSGRTLRLSALESLNDPVEGERNIPLFKHKIFVLCFCHGAKESIPLWRMYGRDENGVCLEFNSLNFACSKEKYKWTSQHRKDNWRVRNVDLIDVVYTDKPHEFIRSIDDEIGLFAPDCIRYLKTDEWSFEQETRVAVWVDVQSGTRSLSWIENPRTRRKEECYTYPDFRHIELNVDVNVFGSMSIIFNPFINAEKKKAIRTELTDRFPFISAAQFKDSELSGKIRLK